MSTLAVILLLLMLLAWSAYFAASETALFSLDRLAIRELERRRDAASRNVLRLLARPNRLLVTLLLGTTLVNIAASSVATTLLLYLHPRWGMWVSLVVMSSLIILVGEITPKSLALSFPVRYSRWSVLLLVVIARIVAPVAALGTWIADTLVYRGRRGGEDELPSRRITPSEVLRLVEEVREQGALSPEETRLAHRVIAFSGTPLVGVMTPWVDVVRVARDAPRRRIETLVRNSRHSRVPVHGADEDDIVGYLTTKTYLANPESDLDEHLRPLLVLPETLLAREALHQMRSLHRQLVLVVSEHGRPRGILTVEDLVEEIVGEIYDEFDIATELVVATAPRRFRLSGRAPLDLAEERTGLAMRQEAVEFVTVNGLLCHLAGQIPAAGTRIHWNTAVFEVLGTDRNRVTWCELTLPAETKPPEDDRGS